MSPLANAFLLPEQVGDRELFYPLHARVCDSCLLVQVEPVVAPDEIFHADYAYFSSYSKSWLEHCERYSKVMRTRLGLGPQSKVIEIASNDGYLLQYFTALGIPVLGIEPSSNTAAVAIARGLPTEVRFFGRSTAVDLVERGECADLLVAKNVLAHVPDINDFVDGVRTILKPQGVFTVEFPHILRTIEGVQFDTIYHEHFTYLSLLAVERIFARHCLRVFDVEELPTHGGSLRLFVCRKDAGYVQGPSVTAVRNAEVAARLDWPDGYDGFGDRVARVRDGLVAFLEDAARKGQTVVGYGAAAKGNTLLNYAGITSTLLPFIVDRNPAKQGRLCPGSHIPIQPPEALLAARPDFVLVLPWNIRAEIEAEMAAVREWGGRFVVAVPEIRIS